MQDVLLLGAGQALLRPGRREGSVSSEASEGLGADAGPSGHHEGAKKLSTWDLLVEIWPAAAALGVNIACVTCLFPFFTYAPSSSGWALLPQVCYPSPRPNPFRFVFNCTMLGMYKSVTTL